MVANACIPVAEFSTISLDVLTSRSKDRIGHEFEIGILQALGNAGLKSLYAGSKSLIVLDALFHLRNCEGDIINSLRLALCRKTIMFQPNFCHLIGYILAKCLGSPPTTELPGIFWCPGINVPSQFHTKLELGLSRLDVAHVNHPETLHTVLVGFRQLITDEGRRDGAEPNIGTGIAQIGKVVIDAVSTAAFTFVGSRKLADVGVVVIHPTHRHIVRNLQTCII